MISAAPIQFEAPCGLSDVKPLEDKDPVDDGDEDEEMVLEGSDVEEGVK